MPFNEDGFYIREKNPINPIAIEMLKYASEAFENVDSNFFEGLHEVAYKISDYIIKKDCAKVKSGWVQKESIKFWDLKEVKNKELDEEDLIAIQNPWGDGEENKPPEIKDGYLPVGVTKRNEEKKLMWFPGWISVETDTPTLKRAFQIEKLPDLVEEFYSSISKIYGEMAHNELREANAKVPIEWYNHKEDYIFNILKHKKNEWWFSIDKSASMDVPIAGNYTTAIIMVHELMHRFLTINDGINIFTPQKLKESEKYKMQEKTPSFMNEFILKETCSIFTEQLFIDYLTEKYPEADVSDFYIKYRYAGFAILKKLDEGFIEDMEKWLKLAKKHGANPNLTDSNKKEITSFVYSTPEFRECTDLPEAYTPDILYRFSHTFGYMFASYLHEKTLKGELNPQDVLEKCTKAYILSHSDEEQQMKLIEELGVPFIKDGKFIMDKNAIDSFYKASISNINRTIKANKKNHKLISLKAIKSAIKKNLEHKEPER